MDPAGIPALIVAIRHCEARWVESVPVNETHEGKTVWCRADRRPPRRPQRVWWSASIARRMRAVTLARSSMTSFEATRST